MIEFPSAGLLRAEIVRRALDRIGVAREGARWEGAGQPEIGHHGIARLAQEDVVRLDVPVNHPAGMRHGEGRGDADTKPYALRLREAADEREPPSEGEGVQFHGHERGAVDLSHIAHIHDVGVAEARGGGRLAAEARLGLLLAGELRPEDLQGNGDLEILVHGLVDPRTGSRPQQAGDPILANSAPQIAVGHGEVLYRGG